VSILDLQGVMVSGNSDQVAGESSVHYDTMEWTAGVAFVGQRTRLVVGQEDESCDEAERN
jgi:hypothetical protein